MDVPRGSRRARHAVSTAASSQEAQLQAQAQLELEAATHHRRNPPRRQALQVNVTPDAAIAVAAGAHQTPDNHGRRHEMEPPPNPFRLHRCELNHFKHLVFIFCFTRSILFLFF
jgi:anaphase-promoting complex subunit 10